MKKFFHYPFLAAALSMAVASGTAQADSITASLTSPLAPSGTPIVVDLTGISTPSQATISRPGFSVAFSTSAQQGVVQRAARGLYAVPVGGIANGAAEYLTGNYGSALTTDPAASGKYFSTGAGAITITFSTPETSLAVLWGSIDTSNSLTFNDAAHYTVTGSDVQTAAAGFAGNGFQGPGGSSYVIIDTTTPFTTVTARSGVVSFEFGGIAANASPFATPEPSSLLLCGLGLASLALVPLRRRKSRSQDR